MTIFRARRRDREEAPRPVTIETPTLALLDGYEKALARGWSPHTMENISARELKRLRAGRQAYLNSLLAQGGPHELPDGRTVEKLPSRVFFIGDGDFCGRINLRWQKGTTDLPEHVSGHVGYTVVPWKQGRGYASAALRLLLPQAREVGLPFVIVTCDDTNHASRRVIEKNGGELIGTKKDLFLKGVTKLVFKIEL